MVQVTSKTSLMFGSLVWFAHKSPNEQSHLISTAIVVVVVSDCYEVIKLK